jgi:hypothetical protein
MDTDVNYLSMDAAVKTASQVLSMYESLRNRNWVQMKLKIELLGAKKRQGFNINLPFLLDARGWSILHHASWQCAPGHIILLLFEELNLDPNLPDVRGNTSMHNAAFQDCPLETMQTLLDIGGRINQRNGLGETAVTEASYRASAPLMTLLLENGGLPNVMTGMGETPLGLAIQERAPLQVIAQ